MSSNIHYTKSEKIKMPLFRIGHFMKKNAHIIIPIMLGIIIGVGPVMGWQIHYDITQSNYKNVMAIANDMVLNKQYDEALDILMSIRFDYEPANEYYYEIDDLKDQAHHYERGRMYMDVNINDDAIEEFMQCYTYEDSRELMIECINHEIEKGQISGEDIANALDWVIKE